MKEKNNHVKWRNLNQLYERIVNANVMFKDYFTIRCKNEDFLNWCDALCKHIRDHDENLLHAHY